MSTTGTKKTLKIPLQVYWLTKREVHNVITKFYIFRGICFGITDYSRVMDLSINFIVLPHLKIFSFERFQTRDKRL